MPYKSAEDAKANSRKRYAENIEARRTYARAYREANRDKINGQIRDWKAEARRRYGIDPRREGVDRERKRDRAYRALYGIGYAEVKLMYDAQSGVCPICLKSLPEVFTQACVDHNHNSGRVRELIHRKCNMLVGVEENNPGFYQRLLDYMERHHAMEV